MTKAGKAKADVWPKTSPKNMKDSLVLAATVGGDRESANSDRVPGCIFKTSAAKLLRKPSWKWGGSLQTPTLQREGKKKGKSWKRSSCLAPQASTPSKTAGLGYLLHTVFFFACFCVAAVIFKCFPLDRLAMVTGGRKGFQNVRENHENVQCNVFAPK